MNIPVRDYFANQIFTNDPPFFISVLYEVASNSKFRQNGLNKKLNSFKA